MSESNTSVTMLEPVEDVGGVAQPLLQVNGLTKHFPVRGGLFAAKRTVRFAANSPPRTGKCFVRPLTLSNGCATPPRSSTGSSISTDVLLSLMA